MNIVVLQGTLSRDPDRRDLASGSVLMHLDVTTPVAGAPRSGGSATVPVAWLDPPANAAFASGDEVVVLGAVRRRFFRAGGSTQSRTEVVAERVVRASRKRPVADLLTAAVGQIAGT